MHKENIEELLRKSREFEQASKKIQKHAECLLEKKRTILDKIEDINESRLKPLKEEVAQIDVEIERILYETGQERIVSDSYGAYISSELKISIVDSKKAMNFLMKNPALLKKDIIKTSEINKMIKEGVVPDPVTDGIDCNETYNKVSYRRK